MKKLLVLSSLALLINPCAFSKSSVACHNLKALQENDASATEVTYLPIDVDGNFSLGSSSKDVALSSFVRKRSDLFWTTRSFNALDCFVDSINNNGEDWTGTFKSKSFVQTKKYIYFTLGGNASNSVVLIDDSDNSTIVTANNKYFSDPNASCNMLIYSMEVPDASLNHSMHIEVKDTTTGGFGGVTFGDLHVNQTEEQVAKATSIYLNNLNYSSTAAKDTENSKLARDYVYGLYSNSENQDLYKFYNYSLTDGNVTFDQGNDNLSTMAFDSEYAEQLTTDTTEFKFDGFISNASAYDWNEQMPFNNNGYFFNGNGYGTRNENAKFRFMTNKFTLSGTGLVSIKMAGRSAQLQVLDPSKIGTGEDPILATLDVQDYADKGVDNVYLNGANYNTMHRVYWDLSKYKGQEIVLAVADKDTGGIWGLVFFDDLITKYDALPSFKVDVFSQTHKDSADTYYGAFNDLYVRLSETEGEYNATAYEAYTFLKNYYAVSSKADKKHNYFDNLTTAEAKTVVDAYEKLSVDAKAIVDSSKDFYFDGTTDDWQKTAPIVTEVGIRVKAQVKVTLVSNNGEAAKEVLADYKKPFTPETPAKESTWDKDYELAGWYTDENCETSYDSSSPLTGDITLYAKWASKDSSRITNIESSATKAQLSYTYESTSVGEGDEKTTTYTISGVAIRFGGLIKEDYYDAVKDHVTSYGVYLTTKMPDGYSSVKQAVIDDKFGENELTTCENAVDAGHPSIASDAQKGSLEGDYYIFNAYLEVNEAKYATTVYAVAFLKLDNGNTAFLNERKGSVVSLAKEYLAVEGATYSEDVKATLTQLSKTSESTGE